MMAVVAAAVVVIMAMTPAVVVMPIVEIAFSSKPDPAIPAGPDPDKVRLFFLIIPAGLDIYPYANVNFLEQVLRMDPSA